MKNILYIHGYGSNRDSYTGNMLKKLFPEYHWVLETFELTNVTACYEHIKRVLKDEQIDTVVSSSLGSIYNLFIKKDKETGKMVNKIFINPCCIPSEVLPRIAEIPQDALENCRAVEYNIYEVSRDNTPDKIFGIFAKNDELLQYHDFFAARYGDAGNGRVSASNCIWVEGGHAHLEQKVLLDAFNQAFAYFKQQGNAKAESVSTFVQKPIVYIDMDDTLVDFGTGVARLTAMERLQYDGSYDEVPGIFSRMDPMPGAVEAFCKLSKKFDVYILSTAPWRNPTAPSDKQHWVQKYFGIEDGTPAYKRLILSHHKELNRGAFLIDDRTKNGADAFGDRLIQFGSERFPDWPTVLDYLMNMTEEEIMAFQLKKNM